MQGNAGDMKYLAVFYDMMRKYQESCKESLGDYSFTPNETSMMIFMLEHPEVDTAKEIAVNLGISQSLICRSVDSLTRKGFLSIEKDKKDRRVNHLTLNIEDKELELSLIHICKAVRPPLRRRFGRNDLYFSIGESRF